MGEHTGWMILYEYIMSLLTIINSKKKIIIKMKDKKA